ncbi:hypothetical protein [Legionella drancourtii]|uniref:Uncharacterized protein n=1 Tax=Legionella drancourtii LLAP12 TaxID=658187 RepID=G9EJI6_9GAMM|nr:hypothetical protein [Legionella drancourtii]EHL32574.1 hypothetical protein LDG_5351 [Legionella drancourtii LLAP12]
MTNMEPLKIIVIDDNKAIHKDFIKTLSFTEVNKQSDIEKNYLVTFPKKIKIYYPIFKSTPRYKAKKALSSLKKHLKTAILMRWHL